MIWKPRQRAAPIVTTNGLERSFTGSMTELVAQCKAVTLTPRLGGMVQVRVVRVVGPESWEGEILQVSPASSTLKVGQAVTFEASHVVGGTL